MNNKVLILLGICLLGLDSSRASPSHGAMIEANRCQGQGESLDFTKDTTQKKNTDQTEERQAQLIADAILNDDLYAVKSILLTGIDVNIKDEHGWTPLLYAVKFNNLSIASYLLSKGAKSHVSSK